MGPSSWSLRAGGEIVRKTDESGLQAAVATKASRSGILRGKYPRLWQQERELYVWDQREGFLAEEKVIPLALFLLFKHISPLCPPIQMCPEDRITLPAGTYSISITIEGVLHYVGESQSNPDVLSIIPSSSDVDIPPVRMFGCIHSGHLHADTCLVLQFELAIVPEGDGNIMTFDERPVYVGTDPR